MYAVNLIRTIADGWSGDTTHEMAYLEQTIELPFCPWAGLELAGVLDMPGAIQRVMWDMEKKRFACHFPVEHVNALSIDSLDYEELIADATEKGWRLLSRVPA